MRSLVWFRSDLRIADNTALHHACRAARDGAAGSGGANSGVIGLFVISPAEWAAHDVAAARIDLVLRTLRRLSDDLHGLNVPLLIAEAERPARVPGLVAEIAARHRCGAVHFNKEYEVDESRRDEAAVAACARAGMRATAHTDQVCFEPGEIRTGEGRFYTVFTPFKRAWIARHDEVGGAVVLPRPGAQAVTGVERSAVPGVVKGFASAIPAALWPAGEKEAAKRLRRFAASAIGSYERRRDEPAAEGTSRLSPYLAIGAISPRRCLRAAIDAGDQAAKEKGAKSKGLSRTSGKRKNAKGKRPLEHAGAGVPAWIGELIWREFYVHVLAGFPRVGMGRAFRPGTDRVRWSDNEAHLEAWKAGRTGVPIVDAGMRQLLAEGWMHNRVRMITAMYLTKNLLIDWRRGEAWFMRNLVDGFFASNNGGWQWSASTGTDAAPYFRVFNPVSQSEKFDPEGRYIRRYVPELRGLDNAAIHEPWTLPKQARDGLDYPEPLVDLAASRLRAIEAFKAIKP